MPSETLLGVDEKALLHRYLTAARNALLWKLEGLSEYDARRPLTPTGTNLLGLVKHAAGVELNYFGRVFDRPFPDPPLWSTADALPASDMFADVGESRESVVAFYGRVREFADATIAALPLDAPGRVSWWSEGRREVTLRQVLVQVSIELHRHAGHADVVRELIDGATGMQDGNTNMPSVPAGWWDGHRARLEEIAATADRVLPG
ncbi:DinB family protein [Lentzea sp. BCCO 10_0061]|uniref:DinB family protein n=1 Tax=Lentzea sokolovensis TaxID=3095429 RepID=A0ABU4V9Z3_9PSEU|nr:DinB family protein [Lentzea sp. BCCO 10_0061]MDX8148584.1 DinB family protein [Lentzea sp. BCCO 10_0061]